MSFNVTLRNVTGTRSDAFVADSLDAAKRRASELLRNGVIHYSVAEIVDGGVRYRGGVSVGGHRVVWQIWRAAAGEAV